MYSRCVLEFATNQLLTIHPNLAFPVEKHDIMSTAEIFLAYYMILMLMVKPGDFKEVSGVSFHVVLPMNNKTYFSFFCVS